MLVPAWNRVAYEWGNPDLLDSFLRQRTTIWVIPKEATCKEPCKGGQSSSFLWIVLEPANYGHLG